MKSDFAIHFIQDWTWLIRSLIRRDFNFFNFGFLVFSIETDRVVGEITIDIALLGFGVQVVIPYKQMGKELERTIKRIKKLDEGKI